LVGGQAVCWRVGIGAVCWRVCSGMRGGVGEVVGRGIRGLRVGEVGVFVLASLFGLLGRLLAHLGGGVWPGSGEAGGDCGEKRGRQLCRLLTQCSLFVPEIRAINATV
jgi:hypothetical protein